MIPIKLAIRNFMCYRDNVPPLYFKGIHTACICGNNGNGKSALIDAMTWAIWGNSRAKSDDDLIHLHEAEMEVEFDFALGEQRYRIIRKHSRPKRRGRSGQSILEFQLATGDGFRSISGDSITQTQQKIINTLHMDYDTFINSAFLRQGHADEFATKRPVERKQVLADILGLSLYDELEERAKELAKQQGTEGSQLESAIKEYSDELAQKPAYEAELEPAQTGLVQIEKAITEQESRLGSLRQKRETLENKRQQLTQLEEHITATRRELERRDHEVRQYQSRIKEYEELIKQRSTIEEGYARLTETRRQTEELNQKLGLLVKLEKTKTQLEARIKEVGYEINKEHAVTQSQITQLEAITQRLPRLKDELRQAEAQWQQLAEQEKTLNNKKQTSQELQKQVNYLESNKARLEREVEEIAEKLSLLLTQEGAKCPLCETEVGRDGLERIRVKYTADRESKADSLKLNQAELTGKKTERETLEGEILPLETRLNQDRASVQSRVSLLKQGINEAQAAENQLNRERERLNEIEQRLASKDFATTEQQALARVEVELAQLDYNSSQHEQVRLRLTELEKYDTPKQKLQEAERLINQEGAALQKAEQASQELRLRLEVENRKGQELSQELESLPQLSAELARTEAEYQTLATQRKQAQELVWQVKSKLERCAELETKKREKERLLSQTSREEKTYKDLAQAFGKRGIQALIIETALPEIETEANKLLSRMTDNRMHVKIETQKETKKGEMLETLDIIISDELGSRPYEMFSGGEAFRINFAIRIALSKLLARRAGAPLPTLIIDEGFGTQDITGIEKIKEAINSIQDDFDKILVITHMEEMRDAFPTRIDVIKTAEGSTIEVS
jgi:exonuclease SbcC